MPWALLHIPLMLPAFALVLVRTAALMLTTPGFASADIPVRVRGGLAATMALMIFPLVQPLVPTEITWSGALLGLFGEMAVGVLMGLSVQLLMTALSLAGLMIGQQAGLALGQVFNPELESSESVLSRFYSYLGLMFFLGAGGHRAVVGALLESFSAVAPGGFAVPQDAGALLAETITTAYVMAIRVAGPTLIALLLLSVAMGFVSRTVPQLNILAVGFPLRIIAAVVISAAALVSVQDVFLESLGCVVLEVRGMLGL